MKSTDTTIANLRQEYKRSELLETGIVKNPIEQFRTWFDQAVNAEVIEPNIMVLATAEKNGKPSARVVLLKGIESEGFTFFTNYLSRKGKELKKNPFASVVFHWADLERQVRIEGKIEKLSKEDSEAYFHSRPVESQIGAIVSPQSQVIEGRQILDDKFKAYTEAYDGETIPKPAHWGGYILKPDVIEFWQGRASRLHDRLIYKKLNEGWKIERLAP